MISVLFVAKNSVYKTMSDSVGEPLDCWDEERDAMKWPGGNPIVAHPPCRLFSQLRHMSTAPIEEKRLAHWAIEQVRQYGGVLEHPARSMLWTEAALPKPGSRDDYGFTIALPQFWFGHKARKNTWLYVCGINPKDIPEIPLKLGEATHTVGGGISELRKRNVTYKPSLWSTERNATPPAFARWLVETAEKCHALTDK